MARKKADTVVEEVVEPVKKKATKKKVATTPKEVKEVPAKKKPAAKKTTTEKVPTEVVVVDEQSVVEEVPAYIDGETMSLDEFYDAIEQTQVVTPTQPAATSKLKNAISYYDRVTQTMADVEIANWYPLEGYEVLYAYLGTEQNKVGLADILTRSFGDYIVIHSYSTKHTPEINVHIAYVSKTTPLGVRNLIDCVTYTVMDWCDAKYFPVKDVNAFSKYMTEEIETPNRTHKHKCMLLKTRPFKLADGTMSKPGVPVIWTFQGSYIDPGTKSTTFIYSIDESYTINPLKPGLTLENDVTINKYSITMNEIIEIINDPNNATVFMFQADELHAFVRKEVNAMFMDLGLELIERLQ